MNEDIHLWPRAVRVFASELARELGPILAQGLKGASRAPIEHSRDDDGDVYLSVRETCERFQISRATFDRMLSDSSSGLAEVIIRLPPVTGRVKVPLRAFEAWLRERRQRKQRRGGESSA
jgi:hypothetical protein